MNRFRYHHPLDPGCPEVREYTTVLFDDPMTDAMGAPTDDIMSDFERRHHRQCKRCREYGMANIEVRD